MMMKRGRDHVEGITMANYLMLLSRGGGDEFENSSKNRVFECKTCNRRFQSFQALGGHRASHKKPRLMGESQVVNIDGSPTKAKTHECSICGLEFAIGQALGGHMRRHRAISSSSNGNMHSSVDTKGNSKRVLFIDLNLTPFENDLEVLKIGSSIPTPLVDCFN